MKTNIVQAIAVMVVVLAAGKAHAQSYLTLSADGSGTSTSSSFALSSQNISFGGNTGIFSDINYEAANPEIFTGLSLNTPDNVNVPDYLTFEDVVFPSTTPVAGTDVLYLDLTKITETGYSGVGVASYSLVGTLTDSLNEIPSTPFTGTVGFSSGSNYSASVEAAPEPSTWLMMLLGLAGMAGWNLRRMRA